VFLWQGVVISMNVKPACAVALAACTVAGAAVSGCGSSSKPSPSTPAPATTSSSGGTAERTQAKSALTEWIAADVKLNKAILRWNKTGPRDARAVNLLGLRRDAYNYRNGIYRFDLAIRKIAFPASVQPDVNTLLDTTKKKVAALDGMAQSSGKAAIQRYFLKQEAADLTGDANRVYDELTRLARGAASPPAGASSEVDKIANGLLKAKAQSGAKGPKDATCAAKLLVKDLTPAQAQQIEAGNIPQTGRTSNAIGAALLTCQLRG
jgi:hypothetical protein